MEYIGKLLRCHSEVADLTVEMHDERLGDGVFRVREEVV